MKIRTRIAANSMVAAVGILAAASSVSDNVIKIIDPQLRDYVQQKIAAIGNALSQVVNSTPSVSTVGNEAPAVAIGVDGDFARLMNTAVDRAVGESSAWSSIAAQSITVTGAGLFDAGAPQATGGAVNTQSGATIPVNFAGSQGNRGGASPPAVGLIGGSPTGVPVSGVAPKPLWGVDDRGFPFIFIDPLTKPKSQNNSGVPKTTTNADTPKDCSGTNARGDNCHTGEVTDVTLHMEVGDPLTEVSNPLAQALSDDPTIGNGAATSEWRPQILTTFASGGSLVTSTGNALSTVVASGSGVPGSESIITASLLPSAIPTPATVPLLGLGLGCMIWLSRQRNRTTSIQR